MGHNVIPELKTQFVLPLGCACRPAQALKRNGLRYFATPFDWMMEYPLSVVQDLLSSCGKGFFVDWEIYDKFEDIGTYGLLDKRTGMKSMHSIHYNNNFDEEYANFISTMTNRFTRLINLISASSHFTIISNRNNEIKEIIQFINYLIKKFNKEILYINIENNIVRKINILHDSKYLFINVNFNDVHPAGGQGSGNLGGVTKYW